jgi:hypothetical protein
LEGEDMDFSSYNDKCLSLIVGKNLNVIDFPMDYIEFDFDGLIFAALALPIVFFKDGRSVYSSFSQYTESLLGLVGQKVSSVLETKTKLEITFENENKIIVPLDAEMPNGPEMATLSGMGKFIGEWSKPEFL